MASWTTSARITGRSKAPGPKARPKATSSSPGISMPPYPAATRINCEKIGWQAKAPAPQERVGQTLSSVNPLAVRFALAWLLPLAASAAGQVQLPEGTGKKTIEAACASCHGLDVTVGKKLSREAWQGVVKTMMDRGASLTKDEAVDVVSYLAKNFGNKERGRELVEDVCT